jgi:dipeptidyl aminopeptidase/acylaminoacyl peptidase
VLQPQFRGSEGFGDKLLKAGYGEWGRKMQSDLQDGIKILTRMKAVDPARVCIVGASYGGYAALAGMALEPGTYRCAVAVAGISDVNKWLCSMAPQASRQGRAVRYWRRYAGAKSLQDPVIEQISPIEHVRDVKDPILLMHGKDDSVVPREQTLLMHKALQRAKKDVRYVELEGEDHWFSRTATRLKMLEETVKFVESHIAPANAAQANLPATP